MAGCDRLIRVHCAWDGWQSAEVPIDALRDVHWRQPAGAPHPLIHAYVDPRTLVGGGLPQACVGSSPSLMLVCVIKRHATASAFAELVQAASAHEGTTIHHARLAAGLTVPTLRPA